MKCGALALAAGGQLRVGIAGDVFAPVGDRVPSGTDEATYSTCQHAAAGAEFVRELAQAGLLVAPAARGVVDGQATVRRSSAAKANHPLQSTEKLLDRRRSRPASAAA